ncbi:GAF domain-containing sensor histidine kinase [Microlunatus soli]|uniref:Histidine kinase n=1 Tax=Microlunatus soli TaxID=630515 RepID=A0A1H1PQP5_9ACTN|nr:GAF domain-containing protein [Microlunatus soli]SDS13450.1 Histidine kinase [Microlunatus soli]
MATPTRGASGSPFPAAAEQPWPERLLAADRSIISDLSLRGTVRRVVRAARDLIDARQVTLEIFADGVDNERRLVRAGGWPVSADSDDGALTERIGGTWDPADRELAGRPFPIRTGDREYGRLFVLPADGADLAPDQEVLIGALVETAGTAIRNAQRYEESGRTQEWLRAVAEVSRSLISSQRAGTLERIAERVRDLADADVVSVVRPDGADDVEVVAAIGVGAEDLTGVRYLRAGSLAGEVMRRRRGVLFDNAQRYVEPTLCPRYADSLGSVMAVPLDAEHGTSGAVVVGRGGQRPFSRSDLEVAANFAGQAALALELAEARADQDRLRLLRDRDRIARDLHDRVIQRLFATGLELQSIATVTAAGPGARLVDAVADLDDTIREIRTTIFALRQQSLDSPSGLRGIVLSVVADLTTGLPRTPEVVFVGPLDTVAEADLISDVEAVVREGLTNVVRHADAKRVTLRIEIAAGELEIYLGDDGLGIADSGRRSGLANLRRRAEQHGGTLTISTPPGGGTTLSWIVPLRP